MTVGARDGICRGSTGATDHASCVDNFTSPWLPPRPLIRAAKSLLDCVSLCQRCPKCHALSYSLMLGICVWHYKCDPEKPADLDNAWELWTFRSWKMNASTANDIVGDFGRQSREARDGT